MHDALRALLLLMLLMLGLLVYQASTNTSATIKPAEPYAYQ